MEAEGLIASMYVSFPESLLSFISYHSMHITQ